MDWGMKNRFNRIFKPATGKTVMLAVDHGYFLGPTTGLENLKKTIEPLLPHTDCLTLTRGMLRTCVPPESDVPIVLRVSGGNSIVGEELSNEEITTAMEDSLRLNVAGLSCSIYVGAPYEKQTLMNLSKLVDWGHQYGIPVLGITAVGKDMVRDARYLGLATRIAAELGATYVKTYYCDDFEKVVDACPVPIVIAGGKKIPEREALQLAYDAISKGAAGVDMGRNIFQSDHPIAMMQAVRSIVHKSATPDEAYQQYTQLKGETPEQMRERYLTA